MKRKITNRERGVALLFVLFALLLLTAIAAGMMFMSDTETAINANYRDSQAAFFAARAGVEEVRQRMRTGDPNTLDPTGASKLPSTVPTTLGGVLYVVNNAPYDSNTSTPWTVSTTYMDDELCHGGYNIIYPGTPPANNVRCTSMPTGSTWYSTLSGVSGVNSTAPGAGTNAALYYKWVRVTWKENQSVPSVKREAWRSRTLSIRAVAGKWGVW